MQKWWEAERSRRFLWLPVWFGAGITLYLGLNNEPSAILFPAFAVGAFLTLLALWRRLHLLLLPLSLVLMGAAWAQIYTHWTPQTVLHESLEPRPVMGTVTDVVQTEHGVRLTLKDVMISDFPSEHTPQNVRLSVRIKKGTKPELPMISDTVNLMAGLRPPMGPALPHGFDFARYFYFREIGAVGFGLPPWRVVAHETSPGIATDFRNWRVRITQEILDQLGPKTGGIAAGLITGEARAISEADFDALRASNLYHIVAISGEHMVVIAGVIFISLRLLALLLPRRLRLRPQVKTVAACATLLLVTAYLFVTGLPTSAVRAYVMIFLLLLAVILRRHVDPMRSLSIAALLMLVANPAVIIDPGFILSFAATLAIIALVETTLLRPEAAEPRFSRALRVLFTMVLVSVVAESATAPFVIAQFNNLSIYGVLANTLATPLVSLFLMPTVALYFILLPLGLHSAALWLMDWGIRTLLAIAYWVSSFPHAQIFVPSIPAHGVGLFALGLMWLCLWQTRARRFGVVLMLAGVATLALVKQPDMLVGSELKQIALRGNDGYVLARGREGSMIVDLWANGLGYAELPESDIPAWRCDDLGCAATVKGVVISFPADAGAVAEDCEKSALVLSGINGLHCANDTLLLDKERLKNSNVLALWVEENGALRIKTSADWQGNRPWTANVPLED